MVESAPWHPTPPAMQLKLVALALAALPNLASSAPQAPIEAIDTWGLRDVERAAVMAELGFAVGDDGEVDREAARARLEALEGIEQARIVEMLMGPQRIMLVGVRERGRGIRELLPPPTGELRLRGAILEAYERSMELLEEAMAAGVWGEDHVDGYALSKYEPRRELELTMVPVARAELDSIVEVLRECADARHRAAAAWALAFADDKARIARELTRAAFDGDSAVRNNATRALGILIDHSIANPELDLRVDPAPFVAMLESIEWTDLNKASFVLMSLTSRPDEALYAQLRATALDGLADIARWTSQGHAYPALLTLGRLAGLDDDSLRARLEESSTDRSDRDRLVDELLVRARAAGSVEGAEQPLGELDGDAGSQDLDVHPL